MSIGWRQKKSCKPTEHIQCKVSILVRVQTASIAEVNAEEKGYRCIVLSRSRMFWTFCVREGRADEIRIVDPWKDRIGGKLYLQATADS